MHWRSLMTASDRKVKDLIHDLFGPQIRVCCIGRIADCYIAVETESDWETDERPETIEDVIELGYERVIYDFFDKNDDEIQWRYHQWLVANGYHEVWKDNPYAKKR